MSRTFKRTGANADASSIPIPFPPPAPISIANVFRGFGPRKATADDGADIPESPDPELANWIFIADSSASLDFSDPDAAGFERARWYLPMTDESGKAENADMGYRFEILRLPLPDSRLRTPACGEKMGFSRARLQIELPNLPIGCDSSRIHRHWGRDRQLQWKRTRLSRFAAHGLGCLTAPFSLSCFFSI